MTEEYNPDRFWEYSTWVGKLITGEEQLERLVSYGLKPHHYLLDIGCGWLRGGIHFIEYLDVGHYYGFDKEQKRLDRGEILLKGKNLIHKKPVIEFVYSTEAIHNFCRKIGERKFDYMMAYSVFTHIDPYMADRLLVSVFPFLEDGGKFFATFYPPSDVNSAFSDASGIFVGRKHARSDEYRVVEYPFSFFEDLAHKCGVAVEHLFSREGDYHGQDWMCFYK